MFSSTAPARRSTEENIGLLDRSSAPNDGTGPYRDEAVPYSSEPGFHSDAHSLIDQGASQLRSMVEYSKSTTWQAALSRFGWFLVPSFLQGRRAREQIRPAKIGPTAYLDGMRGVAALTVFFGHHLLQVFNLDYSWGASGAHYDFFSLPIVRLIYHGPASVSIFFVISGYALSYKPIRLIRARKTEDFYTNMTSMIFRRAIRLYIPTIISTGLIVIMLRIGIYESTRPFSLEHAYFPNLTVPYKRRWISGWLQWCDWASVVFKSLGVFEWDPQKGLNSYDAHLWTIPIEYRCSLYLFLFLVGTAHLKTKWRLWTLAFAVFVTYMKARWDFLLFLYGMAIAEWDHARGAHVSDPALAPNEKKQPRDTNATMKTAIWNSVSLVALFLLSQPEVGQATPGWVTLTAMIPAQWLPVELKARERHWQGIGAGLFVLAVSHSPLWRRAFNSAPIQYLGKISYALYICHGLLTRWIQFGLQWYVYDITGIVGNQFYRGFWIGSVLVFISVIWCADIFWRAVDTPCIKFARWFESKLSLKA
ncbi:acyltransferase family-domain-containing protein [Dactylonectria estremocensis]|uniref:Acyltransferase family-domain-containing protein n=1 Tax=Dactylonectria estremocensis TaxID=1079267 RepID=A0A9P9ENH0_9HYPO|nr:acyltransferase family-domain-containing protein [Dactylonectria estremocensis]